MLNANNNQCLSQDVNRTSGTQRMKHVLQQIAGFIFTRARAARAA